jgi:hypothetical protein
MVDYAYKFCDLLTNVVTLEVPCYGVSFNRLLNAAGSATVSINLDRTDYANEDTIAGTTPGKTAFYIERDGALIWGGILWSRTYQSQAKVLSYTAQTFESYLYKHVIEETLTFINRDQRNILNDLIVHMQQKLQADIDIETDEEYPFVSNSILRSVTFNDYDVWTYGKAIEYLIEFDEGFDYTIEVFYKEDGSPGRRIRTDNVLGASIANTGLVFDYPGNVDNYYWPENASRGAVTVIGTGAGDGVEKIKSKVTQNDLLAAGYPNLQDIYSNQDVSIQLTLNSQTVADGLLKRIPITVPTIEMNPQAVPQFGSWAIGDYAHLEIEDPRFPNVLHADVRVIGFEGAPPSSEGPEKCTLVLEGGDDVA